MTNLECPHCGATVPPGRNFCRSCGTELVNPSECIDTATSLLANRLYDEAIAALANIPNSSPFLKKRELKLGEALLRANRLPDAIGCLTTLASAPDALSAAEREQVAHLLLECGRAMVTRQEYEEGVRCFERAMDMSPEDGAAALSELWNAKLARVHQLLASGDVPTARATLHDVPPKENPSDDWVSSLAEAYSRLGSALEKRGLLRDAMWHVRRAADMRANTPEFTQQLSQIQAKLASARRRRRKLQIVAASVVVVLGTLSASLIYLLAGYIEVHVDRGAKITITKGASTELNTAVVAATPSEQTALRTKRLFAGQYTVAIKKEGYIPFSQIVKIGSSRTTVVEVQLQLTPEEIQRQEADRLARIAEAEKERARLEREEAERKAALEWARQASEAEVRRREAQRQAEIERQRLNERIDAQGSFHVRVYNADDVGLILVNGQEVARVGYRGDSGYKLINRYLRVGENTITFIMDNLKSGWTYGFELKQGNSTLWEDACGVADSKGCANSPGKSHAFYKEYVLTIR